MRPRLNDGVVLVDDFELERREIAAGFRSRPDFADMHASADRVAKLHRPGKIPIEIDETEHAFAENAGLRQHADRGRHRERSMRDAAADTGWRLRIAHPRGSGVKSPTSPANKLMSPSPIVRPGVTTRTPCPQFRHARLPLLTHISRVRPSPTPRGALRQARRRCAGSASRRRLRQERNPARALPRREFGWRDR